MSSENRPRGLFALLFTGFVIYGGVFTVYGATVPRVIADFGWSYAVTGLVLAATAVGFFAASFIAGLFLEGTSPKAVYIAALVLGGGAIALFARWPSPVANMALSFCVGVGQGVIEVVTNYETVRMEKQGQSRLMNFLHAGFSAGAIAAPLLIGAFLLDSGSWRIAFPVCGGLLLLLALCAAPVQFPLPERGAHHGSSGGLALLRQPVMILLCVAMVLYLGSELGTSNWVAEYFVRVLGSPIGTASFAVSALWIGMLAGRLSLSAMKRRGRQETVLLVMSLFCAAALIGFLSLRNILPAMTLVFAIGLAYSGIYPLLVTLAGQAFRSSAAVGMLATSAGIGFFAFPYLFAAIAQAAGLKAGFFLLSALPLGIAIVALLLARLLPRQTPPNATLPLEAQHADRKTARHTGRRGARRS
jgi:fucose permease